MGCDFLKVGHGKKRRKPQAVNSCLNPVVSRIPKSNSRHRAGQCVISAQVSTMTRFEEPDGELGLNRTLKTCVHTHIYSSGPWCPVASLHTPFPSLGCKLWNAHCSRRFEAYLALWYSWLSVIKSWDPFLCRFSLTEKLWSFPLYLSPSPPCLICRSVIYESCPCVSLQPLYLPWDMHGPHPRRYDSCTTDVGSAKRLHG